VEREGVPLVTLLGPAMATTITEANRNYEAEEDRRLQEVCLVVVFGRVLAWVWISAWVIDNRI